MMVALPGAEGATVVAQAGCAAHDLTKGEFMSADQITDKGKVADLVRKLHVERGDAYGRGDVEGYLSYYSADPSIIVLNETMTLQKMADEVRSFFDQGAQVIELSIPNDIDLHFSESGDAALTSFAWREKLKNPDGSIVNAAFLETDVWYNMKGQWKVVALHLTEIET